MMRRVGFRRKERGGGVGASWTLALPLACAVLSAGGPAVAAPTREACADAYETAQRAMKESRLGAARGALTTCLDDACPALLKKDCAQWMSEVERRAASVVLLPPPGTEAQSWRIEVNGQPWPHPLDGKAYELDPGRHDITLREPSPSVRAKSQTIVVREGEKLQRFSLAGPAEARVAPAPFVPTAPEPRPRASMAPAIVAFTIAGGAAAAFGGFALWGKSGQSDLDGCRPYCASADVDRVRTRYLVADVMLGVAALAALTGGAILLLRPRTVSAPVAAAASSPWGAAR